MNEHFISDDDLDALLVARDPLDRGRWEAAELTGELSAVCDDLLAREPGRVPGRRPGVGGRRGDARRRLVVLAAVGLVVVAAALAGVSLLGGGATNALLPNIQLPAAQAEQLDRIASATAAGPSAGHGRWLYLEVTTREAQCDQLPGLSQAACYQVTALEQVWTASANGPTRVRLTFSDFSFPSAHARNVYRTHRAAFDRVMAPLPLRPGHRAVLDATASRGENTSPTDIGDGGNQRVPLASLPTDPERLVRELGDEKLKGFRGAPGMLTPSQRAQQQSLVAENRALGEWDGLSQILVASTSASQRAEAYRALSLVRYVHVLGQRRDEHGRTGVAISFRTGAGSPNETLIVDPATGDLLQDDDDGSITVWLDRTTVNSDTRLPDGRSLPTPHTTSPEAWFAIARDEIGVIG